MICTVPEKEREEEIMKLVVEILTGRFLHVEVEDGATVGELKKAVAAAEESLPEQRLVLVLSSGEVLKNDQSTLADCGIADGSLVYLFFTCLENPNWLTFFEDFVTIVF